MEDKYLQLLKKCLMDNIYQEKREDIVSGKISPDRAHTMIGSYRLDNMLKSALRMIFLVI